MINKAIYLALGINLEGNKELLGMWLSENEGAKFWLSILTELQNRGIKDIFIACVDGLKGFPDAINTAYPDTRYNSALSTWYATHWPNMITLFDYPEEIRRIIYTSNAIESLNSVIRKAIKNRKIFPHDNSALKVVWLAVQSASRKWTLPLHHWNVALNRFMLEYQGRLPKGF